MIYPALTSFLLSFGLLIGMAASVQAAPIVKTVQSGNVKAELSYEKEEYTYKNIRLKITRSGRIVLNKLMSSESGRPLTDYEPRKNFQVLDLDGDKEPEVVLNLYTGGAHCCTYSVIYRYEAAQQQYSSINHAWAHTGFQFKDLNGDGLPEFKSADNEFAYAFSSFAGSGMPIQIWQYRQGTMTEVTRQFPKEISANATFYWKAYQDAKAQKSEVKGLLAAYLADKYLLGQAQQGWKQLQEVYKESDRQQYFTQLRKFLQEAGY